MSETFSLRAGELFHDGCVEGTSGEAICTLRGATIPQFLIKQTTGKGSPQGHGEGCIDLVGAQVSSPRPVSLQKNRARPRSLSPKDLRGTRERAEQRVMITPMNWVLAPCTGTVLNIL